jgi:hypothetical protein
MQSTDRDVKSKFHHFYDETQKIHYITWPSRPIPYKLYLTVIAGFKRRLDFSALNEEKMQAYIDIVKLLRVRYNDPEFSLMSFLSLRSLFLRGYIDERSAYLRRNPAIWEKIAMHYNSGVDILSLSRNYAMPPVTLLRGIFYYNKLPHIHNIFRRKMTPEDGLALPRDQEQFRIAEANDAESTFNQQYIADIAQQNEDMFVNFFVQLGIGVKTQTAMVAEQVQSHGRAIITPDLLFTDDVFINGEKINWIDFKDYIGSDVWGRIKKSNHEQCEKYTRTFGPGALAFSRSFVEDYDPCSGKIFDASSLGLCYL